MISGCDVPVGPVVLAVAPICALPVTAKGVCKKHYNRWYKGMPVCPGFRHRLDDEVEARPRCRFKCPRPCNASTDMCEAHRQRVKKHGDALEEKPLLVRGSRRYVDSDGYVVVPADGHPNGFKNGSIFEHMKVMSDKIGRPLLLNERVHHKNGQRDDNRPDNLELWLGAHPRGCRIPDQIRFALEVIDRYGVDPAAWEDGK